MSAAALASSIRASERRSRAFLRLLASMCRQFSDLRTWLVEDFGRDAATRANFLALVERGDLDGEAMSNGFAELADELDGWREEKCRISTSSASGLGDARILGRYQKLGWAQSFGFEFGLKLPTGRFDQNFAAGPQAGAPLDRGLQLGSGTTDLLAGMSWFARPAVNIGYFAQALLDQPLAARAGFLPATSINLSAGIRWLNASRFTPQLQLNVHGENREHGAEADTANSGATLAFLSPGLTAELAPNSSTYVFAQLPIYQRVNGLQLEPKWLLSVGLRWKL